MMIKRIGLVSILMLIGITVVVSAWSATELIAQIVDYKIIVNGEWKEFLSPIVTIGDRTYIPLREAGEMLGMQVEWNEESQTIKMSTEDYEEEANLYPFKMDEKWGYMNETGKIVIAPQYQYASGFCEGLAAVMNEEKKWGYIDDKGVLTIPYQFLEARKFSEGFAVARIRDYSQGEGPVITDARGPYIYIDTTGKDIFQQEFVSAHDFCDSYAVARLSNGRETYIDRQGETASDIQFIYVSDFHRGYASVEIKDEGKAIVDRNFNVKYIKDYDAIKIGDEGYITASKNGKYGVINTKGEVLIDFKYEFLSEYSNGLFVFRKDSQSGEGYLDIDENIIIPPKTIRVLNNFQDGYAIVVPSGKELKYGVINKNGKFVIEPVFESIQLEGKGVYRCRKMGEGQYFNTQGEEIVPH